MTYSTTAVIPIKNLKNAKQRLQPYLSSEMRQALMKAMFIDVVNATVEIDELTHILIVSSEPTISTLNLPPTITILQDRLEQGQSSATQLGIQFALEKECEQVILLPGDCPLLNPQEVSPLLEREFGDQKVILIPDRHQQGTNGILLKPPDVLSPSFGPDSLQRHRKLATEADLQSITVNIPSLALDIDTPEDLAELQTLLHNEDFDAPATREVMRTITSPK